MANLYGPDYWAKHNGQSTGVLGLPQVPPRRLGPPVRAPGPTPFPGAGGAQPPFTPPPTNQPPIWGGAQPPFQPPVAPPVSGGEGGMPGTTPFPGGAQPPFTPGPPNNIPKGWVLDEGRTGGVRPWDSQFPGFDPTHGGPFYKPGGPMPTPGPSGVMTPAPVAPPAFKGTPTPMPAPTPVPKPIATLGLPNQAGQNGPVPMQGIVNSLVTRK